MKITLEQLRAKGACLLVLIQFEKHFGKEADADHLINILIENKRIDWLGWLLGKFPELAENFNQWGMKNDVGWTVAHTTAFYGRLPKNFNQWAIADNDGWTVAHVAARYGHLPPDFNQWNLKDKQGRTVRDFAVKNNFIVIL